MRDGALAPRDQDGCRAVWLRRLRGTTPQFGQNYRRCPNEASFGFRGYPLKCRSVIALGRSLAKLPVMKFVTTLDRDEDGIWIAECPAIPGCVSQGSTRDEALANIREAIALCLEVRAERGMPLTIETRQIEVTV